jgi:hypothetical protein
MTLLLKFHFSAETPKFFQSLTYIPFLCTRALEKIPILTHMPSCRRVGSLAARAGRPCPTNGAGPPRSSPRGDWRGWSARRRLQRGRAAAAGGGGRGGLRLRRGRAMLGNARRRKLLQVLGRGLRRLERAGETRRGGSPAADHGGRGGLRERRWRARGGKAGGLK